MSTATVERLEKRVAKETVERARQRFGLAYSEVAEALGVDRRTLFRYRKKLTVPSQRVRVRLEKMREIGHLLDELFEERDAALEWLYSPVPVLRGRRPVDLVRDGELDGVLSVLAGLYAGAHD